MTDKQIIIDGTDVSGCEWIREVGLDSEYICTCNSPNKTSGYCKYNPNCHYKNWKRKEQECEELKIYIESNEQQVKEVETLVMDNDRLINDLNQLKQTITEIKEYFVKQCEICIEQYAVNDEICKECEIKDILQKISEVENG